jgi:hypothetical protein
MKIRAIIIKSLLAVSIVAALGIVGGIAKHTLAQQSCYQYDANNMPSVPDPIFNHFCGVPNVGNESDFVRIRHNVNGNNEDNSNAGNGPFTIGDTLNAACNTGDKFDIWTYIHNNANPQGNDNGNGHSVAHNVMLALNASGLGTTGSQFNFSSTISASNAASVSDSVALKCNNGNFKLTLVPNVVHIYSQPYGWKTLPDGSVNSTFPIGSPNFGSGNFWGCWEYRTVVVYTVTVEKQQPQPAYKCELLKLDIIDKTNRKVNATVTYKATNGATFKNATFNWGDNSSVTVNGTTASHQYSADNNYNVTATLKFDIGGTEVQDSCSAPLSFTSTPPPPSTPPAATTLPNTGPGSVAAIFGGVTAFAGMFHYLWSGRKQTENIDL